MLLDLEQELPWILKEGGSRILVAEWCEEINDCLSLYDVVTSLRTTMDVAASAVNFLMAATASVYSLVKDKEVRGLENKQHGCRGMLGSLWKKPMHYGGKQGS